MSIQTGKLIYHLTDMENMHSIFQNGLLSRACLSVEFVDVADPEIIAYRQSKGVLNYVPFHFFEPTPFAGAVERGYPEKSFVYIAIYRTFAQANGFLVLTRHPMSGQSHDDLEVFPYVEGMEKIDWNAMETRDYHDEYVKCVCMAECLARDCVNINNLILLNQVVFFVKNDGDKEILQQEACYAGIKGALFIQPNPWMFA